MRRKKSKVPTASKPSHIAGSLYNPSTKELTVTFHNGRIYRYADVPKDKAAGLSKATSKGTYFHEHIRDKHPTREMTP